MHKLVLNIILVIFVEQIGLSQTNNLNIQWIKKTSNNYKSFVTVDSKLFALNNKDQLIIWDLSKLDTIHFGYNDTASHYTAITKDKQGQVFLGTNKGVIYKINPNDFTRTLFLEIQHPIHAICFNATNKVFLVIPEGVYQPTGKKCWTKFTNHTTNIIRREKIMGVFKKRTYKYFLMPQFTFLDNQGKWWLCSSYGEFGGDIQIFDTKNEKIYNNKFDNINPNSINPRSIFNDKNGNIYITSGLQHFLSSGEIYKIDSNRTVTKIYNSKDYNDTTKKKEIFEDDGVFVGPGTYNAKDNCVYFATTDGIYKAALPEKGKLQTLQLLLNPTLNWGRERLVIGMDIAIKKLEFTNDNRLLFLTSNNGFGLYDREKLIMFK